MLPLMQGGVLIIRLALFSVRFSHLLYALFVDLCNKSSGNEMYRERYLSLDGEYYSDEDEGMEADGYSGNLHRALDR